MVLSFPNDSRRSTWIQNVKWEKWVPSKSSRICSKHFHVDCFEPITEFGVRRRLKKNAIPTIFGFPSHLQKRKCERPPPKNRDSIV